MSVSTCIILDALHEHEKHEPGLQLHPDLKAMESKWLRMRSQWFLSQTKNALAWQAAIASLAPAALAAQNLITQHAIDARYQQLWLASPYHATLVRDRIRIMPEHLWQPHDEFDALCQVLNPMLGEEGMQLLHDGVQLFLACEHPIDAQPAPFSILAGKQLPNQHPEGVDGGRIMRLLAEIQMRLHQEDALNCNGLWLWGACPLPMQAQDLPPMPKIVHAEQSDTCTLTHQHFILCGEHHAVLLQRTWLPGFRKSRWIPKEAQSESALLALLRA